MTATVEPEPISDDPVQSSDDSRTIRRLAWFAAALVALLLIHGFVVEPVRVRSESMKPTLSNGAVVLIDKITFHFREPQRGDVVITQDPRTGQSIVKRVVAVGGDSVGIDNGVLMVNGAKVVEDYIENKGMDGYFFGPDVVPAGHVFLLGDNRANSIDSRAFGPINVGDVDGRVLAKIWPPG